MDQLRLQACALVRNGCHSKLRELFSLGKITPNFQNEKNGLAPVHYCTQMFRTESQVSIEDIDQTIKVLLEFGADFSLTALIKDRQGIIKTISAMDMVINNVSKDQDKFEKGFLPNFEPIEITRALRAVPICAPHPDLTISESRAKKLIVGRLNARFEFANI